MRNVAFFGATGGCTNACLAFTIQYGDRAIALTREPRRLRQKLLDRKISPDILDDQLSVVQGDVRDEEAVAEVLRFGGNGVDTVISGLGGVATPQWSFTHPLTVDPPICSEGTKSILAAMAKTPQASRALLIVISANGVRNVGPRDYPLVLTPLYRWMLCGVYDDKREMEKALSTSRLDGGYVIVRPSPLQDGEAKGLTAVRQGTDKHPVLGFGIGREDVGLWMYESLIQAEDRAPFKNAGVCITY